MTGNKMARLASSNVGQVVKSTMSEHSGDKEGKEPRSKRRGGKDAFNKRRDDDCGRWEGRLVRLARPRLGTVATRVRAMTTKDAEGRAQEELPNEEGRKLRRKRMTGRTAYWRQ